MIKEEKVQKDVENYGDDGNKAIVIFNIEKAENHLKEKDKVYSLEKVFINVVKKSNKNRSFLAESFDRLVPIKVCTAVASRGNDNIGVQESIKGIEVFCIHKGAIHVYNEGVVLDNENIIRRLYEGCIFRLVS